jgi:hypothetical protein
MTTSERNRVKIHLYIKNKKMFALTYGGEKLSPIIEKTLMDELEKNDPRDLDALLNQLKN